MVKSLIQIHPVNVRAIINDRRTYNTAGLYYSAAVLNGTDYFPFGSEMRSSRLANYRFGFNGKELDKSQEFGILNAYDYGFRIYNPGIGRFLSVDPLNLVLRIYRHEVAVPFRKHLF